jgi:molybdopterin converting factor small subunit
MMIRLKLYSLLKQYLPSHATDNECTVKIKAGDTVLDVVHFLNIPETMPKTVLVNGLYSSLDGKEPLADGDVVTMFPLMAGG